MTKRQCIACEEEFQTNASGDSLLACFCWACRKGFRITTEEDAEELAGMIDVGAIDVRAPVSPSTKPTTPKVDPAAVARGIRTQVDYTVAPISEYKKPITYVAFKNGLFEVRHSDLATVIVKPKEVLGVLEEAKEGVTLNIPKLPFAFLQQTISFFRGVEGKMKGSSEALVQVWWDRETKQHTIHVPAQQVSGGSVRHESVFDQDNTGRHLHVADIHSHGSNMSAFWSGVDDADEKRVTTERLFGVIGKVTDSIPQWKWRMRTRDGFIDLAVSDIFELPQETVTFTVQSADLFRCIGDANAYQDGKVQLWCPIDPFTNVEVPTTWYDQVKAYSQTSGGHGHWGWNGKHTTTPMKGYIYIDGLEYLVEDGKTTPTGHKLMRRPANGGQSA